MSVVKAGQKFSFGVTFDSDTLFVAAKVYNNSGASPVLLSTVPMTNYYGNTYQGSFLAPNAESLLIQKSVYTDGTYTTLDPNYAQADETQQVVELDGGGGGGSGGDIIGYIYDNNPLIGVVVC